MSAICGNRSMQRDRMQSHFRCGIRPHQVRSPLLLFVLLLLLLPGVLLASASCDAPPPLPSSVYIAVLVLSPTAALPVGRVDNFLSANAEGTGPIMTQPNAASLVRTHTHTHRTYTHTHTHTHTHTCPRSGAARGGSE